MRKILLLTASLFLTIGAMAQTPIQSGQFDANKLYRIYNQKTENGAQNNDTGYMAISVNDAKTQGVMKAYDANDEPMNIKQTQIFSTTFTRKPSFQQPSQLT